MSSSCPTKRRGRWAFRAIDKISQTWTARMTNCDATNSGYGSVAECQLSNAGSASRATAAAGAERRRDRKMLPSEWKAEPHEHPRPYAAAGSHSYTCPCRKLELEHIDGVVRPRLT